MSKQHILTEMSEIVLGESLGYRAVNQHTFNNDAPEIVYTVQDCNMIGEYFRNFYIYNGELRWFVSKTNFFRDKNYDQTLIKQFQWKRTIKKNNLHFVSKY